MYTCSDFNDDGTSVNNLIRNIRNGISNSADTLYSKLKSDSDLIQRLELTNVLQVCSSIYLM